MKGFWIVQGMYLLRLLLAAFCGIFIGYERDNRMKMAGIRTHSIVALAAALMMVVSKYGFSDVLARNVNLDPSRVGASVITAVSFQRCRCNFYQKTECERADDSGRAVGHGGNRSGRGCRYVCGGNRNHCIGDFVAASLSQKRSVCQVCLCGGDCHPNRPGTGFDQISGQSLSGEKNRDCLCACDTGE